MPELRQPTRPRGGIGDTRSALAQASDARPFKPYVYRGSPGPVIGRRQLEAFAVGGAGPDPLAMHELAADIPAPAAPPPAPRCETCGYLITAPGHAIACG